MPQARQNNLIWTADAMIDVDPVFVQNGGYLRTLVTALRGHPAT
jgi:hypothetical protein